MKYYYRLKYRQKILKKYVPIVQRDLQTINQIESVPSVKTEIYNRKEIQYIPIVQREVVNSSQTIVES